MDETEPVFHMPQAVQCLADEPVDRMRPLASPEDQNRKPLVDSPVRRPSIEECGADRIPSELRPAFGEPPLRCRKGEKDPVGKTAEDPVGQARKGVLLGDGGRRSHDARGQDRRPRGVPPHAENDCRSEFAEDPEGGEKACGDLPERPRGPRRPPSLDPFDRYGPQGETQGAQDPFFQASLGADEEDAVPRIPAEELLGNGDSRKEVAARPAAGDDHPDAAVAYRRLLSGGGRLFALIIYHVKPKE